METTKLDLRRLYCTSSEIIKNGRRKFKFGKSPAALRQNVDLQRKFLDEIGAKLGKYD